MQMQGRKVTRTALKFIHTVAVCVWIGSGLCVLVLLRHGRLTGDSDELFVLNNAIASIDDLLIKPSAAATFVSGMLSSLLSGWGGLRHRWIMAKLVLTLGAIVFGALYLGPWLKDLSLLTAADRLAVFDDLRYARSYQYGTVSGIIQTALLLLLAFISISKPSFAMGRFTAFWSPAARAVHDIGKLMALFRTSTAWQKKVRRVQAAFGKTSTPEATSS